MKLHTFQCFQHFPYNPHIVTLYLKNMFYTVQANAPGYMYLTCSFIYPQYLKFI